MVNHQTNGSRSAELGGRPVAVGLIIVSHCRIAEEMLRAAELILGPLEAARAISIDHTRRTEETVEEIEEAMKSVELGKGVLILTDLYGGTPANLSLSFAGPNVEVVSGMNLPMLIKFSECRYTHPVAETAQLLKEYGQRHISLASRFVTGSSKQS